MKALYVSHTGLSEPLGQSQVLPYLTGLARAGWEIEVVGFEPPSASEDDIRDLVARQLAPNGLRYVWTRRSPSNALATKVYESGVAFLRLISRALLARPRVLHARSYLPGAVAQLARTLAPGARFIFDCRGLLGDEYADFGHWTRDSFRYRLLKRAERRLFGGADAVVVLTDRLRNWLRDESGYDTSHGPIEVIPCCVDLARFDVAPTARTAARQRLGAGERFVLAYAGTLGSWYCEDEMAALFAAIRRRRPALFAVLTRSPSDRLKAALARAGVSDDDVVIQPVKPADMPLMLSGADATVSLARPLFSKIASSPVKMAEYLAMGLPMVLNRGIGDFDRLIGTTEALVDAGGMSAAEIERSAESVLSIDPVRARREARQIAETHFSLEQVGVPRYVDLYRRLAS
jgi:glycosyltransferase involved in cell wall biosynthesis